MSKENDPVQNRLPNMIILRPFEQQRLERLIELARSRFDATLSRSEANILLHSVAPYELPKPPDEEPRPPVRSAFLRWLLTDPDAVTFIDPKGIRIWCVSIPEALDLQNCTVTCPLHLLYTDVEAELGLFGAEVKALFIFGGRLRKGLLADGIRTHGPIFIHCATSDAAIRMIGAQIDGNIDLSGTEIKGSGIALGLDGARIRGSAFLHNGFNSSGEIRMLNARIGGDLGFNGARLTATDRSLSLDKVVVEGNVSLGKSRGPDNSVSVFHSDGSVNLLAAQIQGDLDCEGANLTATGISLNLNTARIRGHVYLRNGFRARGQLQMHSVNVGNSIDLSGAELSEAEIAIVLQEATIRGTVSLCDGFTSFGRVDLQSARIDGNLVCDDCKLPVLYCVNTVLKGDLQWTGIRDAKLTTLCLNGASIKNLRDERESWPSPGALRLDGFTYEELTLHSARTEINQQARELGPEHPLKANDRVAWLRLQPKLDQAEPQPWMQIAALFRTKGDEDSAKRIIFGLRYAQIKLSSQITWPWKLAFARLQQQPLLVLAPIALFTSLAACLFWSASIRGAMAPTSKEAYVAWATGSKMETAYPRFNPFFYSLENDLPLVKFGLDDKWAPDLNYKPRDRFISYGVLTSTRIFLILCGWLQATLLAAAIGSRFKN